MEMSGHIGKLMDAGSAARSGWPGHSLTRTRTIALLVICGAILLAAGAHLAEAVSLADGAGIELVELACLVAVSLIAGICVTQHVLRAESQALHAVQGLDLERAAAQAANVLKSRYLASISHEIRSPLNAIYGYAQLMEIEEGVNPREAARIIRRSAEHLTSLVDGLLDISQIENGVMRLKTDVVNLPDFLDQIFWMMRPAAGAKGLTLVADFAEDLPGSVRMDHSRLRQVLINLLSNAIKYTEQGGVTFKARYSGQIATFEVVDTGPGIAEDDRERIFDPFERGGGDDQMAQPGVGLGLPIARAITQILGGELHLASSSDAGSCFRVTLMLGSVAPRIEGQQVLRNIIGYEGRRRSALIVDDDVRQLSFLRTLLESLGFQVSSVPDGETAVSLCTGRRFDFALLDISMPGMSGWDVATHLRGCFGQDIHIIMVSANTGEFHKPETPLPAHDMFLTKPFEFGALLEAIGGLLNLTWKWDKADSDEELLVPTERHSALCPAALVHVDRMKQHLQIGHVRGIEAEIAGLSDAAPEATELVRELYACLDRFDLAAMRKRLSDV